MAINLVSLVMQFLTPDMIGRIAGALGLDRGVTQTALGGAVPALLAGLSNVAAQPGGAQKLTDAVKQQTGALDSLSSMVGGSGQGQLLETGSRILSSLLGGQQTALAEVIGKFAGLRPETSGSLLGMLAPAILGVISKHLGGGGINASSVASLLAGQRDNIAAALPAGLGNQLKSAGLLDALGGVGAAAAGEARRAGATAARTAANATDRARSAATSTSYNWLYWAIPALILAALLAWFFASNRSEQVAQPPAGTATQSLTVGGVDIPKEITGGLETLRSSLQGVTDAGSAKAALPKLQDAKAQIDKVNSLAGQLSPEQRKMLAGLINQFMPTLNPLFDKVLTIPGVADLIKPIVDQLRATLTALAAT